jgi:hypothetical protein
MLELEIGGRLLTAIATVVLGVLVERWWLYASRRRP